MVPETRSKRGVLVVGGGVAGMHASLILAEAKVRVYLVDSAPTVGGHFNLLDTMFPSRGCGICNMSPRGPAYCPVFEVGRRPEIRIMVNTAVTSVSGDAGEFLARVATRPEFVKRDECDSCGECEKVCPVSVRVPPGSGMNDRKAIYRPGHRAVPGGFALDEAACTKCGKCVDACPRGAIDLFATGTATSLEVGAIIVAPGMSPCDPRTRPEYSYGPGRDVITGLELERLMSASGPTGGRLVRPSNGQVPGSVAFVQCVGSRDRSRGNPYCSSVCCMYALKEAMSVKELLPGATVKVFHVDVRAQGKGFEEYYARARSLGVEFQNCRVSAVEDEGGHLSISGESSRGVERKNFDLVVLSTGFVPPDLGGLAQALGIDLGPFGFVGCLPQARSRVRTSRSGVFVCGGAAEPQDIPTAIMWAGACALQALRVVGPGADVSDQRAGDGDRGGPDEAARDIAGLDGGTPNAAPPKIGVFVCRCGPSTGGLRLGDVAEAALSMDGVVVAGEIADLCRERGIEALRKEVLAGGVNRVVIAACSPRDILDLVESGLSDSGAWRGLVEIANIREQCAWAHDDREAATKKARDLVAMAVEQARLARPLGEQARPIPPGAVVMGGGIAGMQAACCLADLGHQVHLVEREPHLGGRARRIARTLDGTDVQDALRRLEEQVRAHSRIDVHASCRVADVSREAGGFRVRVACSGEGGTAQENGSDILCGAVVVATGGAEADIPAAFRARGSPRVMTQTELEETLIRAQAIPDDVHSVVMIQCAGSRDEERPYCSKVCCSQAIKNALSIKAARPDVEVFVLHRDVRVSGLNEIFYEQAREEGVVFVRYPEHAPPELMQGSAGGAHVVQVHDESLGEVLRVPADLVVLSVGVEGSADPELAQALCVPVDRHGFFTEANLKARPVDFLVPGVYVCGLARAPGFVSDALISAEAAAARAGAYLSAREARAVANLSCVRTRRCVGCGVCVDVCPFDARSIDDEAKVARVDEFLCRGCGACQVACPSGAAEHAGFEARRIMSALDVAFG